MRLYAAPPAPAAVPVDGLAELLEESERAAELARRLVAAGPKAAHVSASETHEISEFVLAVVELLPALATHPQPATAKDLAALRPRIVAAIERIVSGHGCMRVPAEETDPDLVLADVLSIIDQQAKPEVQ